MLLSWKRSSLISPSLVLLTINSGCTFVEQRAQGQHQRPTWYNLELRAESTQVFVLSAPWGEVCLDRADRMSREPLSPIAPPFLSLPFFLFLSLSCSHPPSAAPEHHWHIVKFTHRKRAAPRINACVLTPVTTTRALLFYGDCDDNWDKYRRNSHTKWPDFGCQLFMGVSGF